MIILTIFFCIAFFIFVVVMTKLNEKVKSYPKDVTKTMSNFNKQMDKINKNFSDFREENKKI